MSVFHPQIKLFAADLEKGIVTASKAGEFERFMAKKLAEGSEDRIEAERLLKAYRAKGIAAKSGLKTQTEAATPKQDRGRWDRGPNRGHNPSSPRGPSEVSPLSKDSVTASKIGAPFHNPYTFVPFPMDEAPRAAPTLRTVDEVERDRFTGVLRIKLRTLSPLLTSFSVPDKEEDGHKTYAALTLGADVIIPSTGVRGALRSLLSILTGGTLGYVDEAVWLCQGRDRPLGPSKTQPQKFDMAEVVEAGGPERAGRVRLGEVKLVSAQTLESTFGDGRIPRPDKTGRLDTWWVNATGTSVRRERDANHEWRLRTSGRPVNNKGKREALFRPSEELIELPASLWLAYQGRYRHGDRSELKEGDLVWLERRNAGTPVQGAPDVESLQWARWGRQGERLLDIIKLRHPQVLPDSLRQDGKVDLVTDLFGQVARDDLATEATAGIGASRTEAAPTFAARVRFDNLVFRDAAGKVVKACLAPLQPPHPGCAPFYRENSGPDAVKNAGSPLRGYKVYRTTQERGEGAPWRFSQQGVYNDNGRLKPEAQRVNKTVQLLPTGSEGVLQIACLGLSGRELSALVAMCAVDWRLGGGKPLGLGHCRVTSVESIDEEGKRSLLVERKGAEIAVLPEDVSVDPFMRERMTLWQASQEPVEKLRYPRAVQENKNKKNRGGHVWFARHAAPKKSVEDAAPVGLETRKLEGGAAEGLGGTYLSAQVLPYFKESDPRADVLYGYDLFEPDTGGNAKRPLNTLTPFNEQLHARANDQSGGPQGQSRESRQQGRRDRR